MRSENLLIISQKQFGYHTDYLQYGIFLKKEWSITFICWDYNWEKINEENIEVIYLSREGNIIKRNLIFINNIIKIIKSRSFAFLMICYFRGCSVIPIFFNKKVCIHLDIRTGSVDENFLKREFSNQILKFESRFFKSISIISQGLLDLLKINKKALILALGANPVYLNRKKTDKFRLLYVGTFNNRRIEDTVEGIGLIIERHPNFPIRYTIIGNGNKNEEQTIIEKIRKHKLETIVEMKGYIPFNELNFYYENADAGVSYIPMKPYFEYQPATKTFEYLMAGLPVIATKTYENKQVVTSNNGYLINDDPEKFAEAVFSLYNNINCFDEKIIRLTVNDFQWSKIANRLKSYIQNKINEGKTTNENTN